MPRKIKCTEEQVIDLYTSKPMTLSFVANTLSISTPIVANILHKHNIPIYNRQQIMNYGTDEHFFEYIDTEEKAYLFGLLFGDGCIFEKNNGHNIITITLQEKDAYMINKIKSIIKINRNIVTDKRDNSKSITLSSDIMAEHLIKWGLFTPKSFRRELPIDLINQKLVNHMIRGLFDADGSIYLQHNNQRGTCHYTLAFCGNETTMYQIRDYLRNKLGVFKSIVYREQTNISSIRWSSRKDLIRLKKFLYDNATIYLYRKKNIFDSNEFYENTEVIL